MIPDIVQVPIKRGENGGKTLPHKNVVRELVKLGAWSGKAQSYALPAGGRADLKTAILVQAGARAGRSSPPRAPDLLRFAGVSRRRPSSRSGGGLTGATRERQPASNRRETTMTKTLTAAAALLVRRRPERRRPSPRPTT